MDITYIASLLVTLCSLIRFSQQGMLPRGHRHLITYPRNSYTPLKIREYSVQDRFGIENLSLRKGTPKYYSKIVVLPIKKFDENGMIYLSKPVYKDESKIIDVLNKIVKFKLEEDKYESLREGRELFNDEDVQLLEQIVDDIDGNSYRRQDFTEAGYGGLDDADKAPNLVYEFSDLVM